MPRIERALLSVTDKTGLVPFAGKLHEMGVELISTGGTAKLLQENGIPVREVAEITGFPEMLDGRVKTIHPRIAAGILAIRANPEHMRALEEHGILAFQMVVVNLYQFERFANKPDVTREELMENIDIGGPTMIRAAAKNFQDVAVLVSPDQYEQILERNGREWRRAEFCNSLAALLRRHFCTRLLTTTRFPLACFRSMPADKRPSTSFPPACASKRPVRPRFGMARIRIRGPRCTPFTMAASLMASSFTGRSCPINNLVDLDAAWQLVQEFELPAAAIIKHTNPCGCAEQSDLADCLSNGIGGRSNLRVWRRAGV